jgi:hypothetical protein
MGGDLATALMVLVGVIAAGRAENAMGGMGRGESGRKREYNGVYLPSLPEESPSPSFLENGHSGRGIGRAYAGLGRLTPDGQAQIKTKDGAGGGAPCGSSPKTLNEIK